MVQELRPAVLSGCVQRLMRQRDVKTDSCNEMADGHTAEQDIRAHRHTGANAGKERNFLKNKLMQTHTAREWQS